MAVKQPPVPVSRFKSVQSFAQIIPRVSTLVTIQWFNPNGTNCWTILQSQPILGTNWMEEYRSDAYGTNSYTTEAYQNHFYRAVSLPK